jgi:predicted transcriptional regulator
LITRQTQARRCADPRGQNKAKILEELKDGPKTASKISKQTGIGTGTASTTLTKMTKAGDIVKAERGYALPQ